MVKSQWPWQYNFPPFFSLQPNLSTREKQLEAWCGLVLDYCQENKIYTLDVIEAQNSDLFHNTKINRKLSTEGVQAVIKELERKGHVEWLDKQKKRCHILWRTVEEWASLIYRWALENGFLNTVHTLLELTQEDETGDHSFAGLDQDILLKALRHLETQNKAEIIGEAEGVKFF